MNSGENLKKILYAEDDSLNLDLFKDIAKTSLNGYEIYLVSSEEEALKEISQNPFDIVITDGSLKGDKGYESGRNIAKEAKKGGAYVIGLSGNPHKLEELANQGIIDINYEKPYDIQILLEIIKNKPNKEKFNRLLKENEKKF